MITTVLNADIEEQERQVIEAYRQMDFIIDHPWLSWFTGWWWVFRSWLMTNTVCKWFDHQLVDDCSYANGDSGGEGWMCTRCGQSWWHQYY